jgi:hypothetical protein
MMADRKNGFLRGLFGSDAAQQTSRHFLGMCQMNLDVRRRTIDSSLLTQDLQKAIYGEAERILAEIRTELTSGKPLDLDMRWSDIYKAERLLDLLLSGERLKQEIEANLSTMEGCKTPEASRYRDEQQKMEKALGSAADADAVRRDFLIRVLESLQWFYRSRDLTRPVRIDATNIILVCGLMAAVLVIAPYVVLSIWNLNDQAVSAAGLWARVWQMFPLYTALSLGLLGAFFSRLIFMQQNVNLSLDDAFLQRELSYTLLRAGVGVCGALIVYLFLRSGIVDGAVFPHFDKIAIENVIVPSTRDSTTNVPMKLLVPSKDLALLIVWSFIAGFSEALVPAILARTTEQFSSAATSERK